MPIRSLSDIVATFIAWLPILMFITAFIWVASVAAMNLETRTIGSEVFVTNREAPSPTARIAQPQMQQSEIVLSD